MIDLDGVSSSLTSARSLRSLSLRMVLLPEKGGGPGCVSRPFRLLTTRSISSPCSPVGAGFGFIDDGVHDQAEIRRGHSQAGQAFAIGMSASLDRPSPGRVSVGSVRRAGPGPIIRIPSAHIDELHEIGSLISSRWIGPRRYCVKRDWAAEQWQSCRESSQYTVDIGQKFRGLFLDF